MPYKDREKRLAFYRDYAKKHKEHYKYYHKNYALKNKTHLKELQRNWKIKNRERHLKMRKLFYQKTKKLKPNILKNQRLRRKQKQKIWIKNNITKVRLYGLKSYYKNKKNPKFILNIMIKRNMHKRLKLQYKETNYIPKLKYDINILKNHLEKQFTSEMNWENYGTYWDIDHVIPLSWFKTQEQIINKGWAINNLQPLESSLNASKKNRYAGNPKTNIKVIELPAPKDEELTFDEM